MSVPPETKQQDPDVLLLLSILAGHDHGKPDSSVPTWVSEALCAQVDPELFYPEKGQPALPAKRICQTCPVRDACLSAALESDERHGIWGGLSAADRARLQRTLRAA